MSEDKNNKSPEAIDATAKKIESILQKGLTYNNRDLKEASRKKASEDVPEFSEDHSFISNIVSGGRGRHTDDDFSR